MECEDSVGQFLILTFVFTPDKKLICIYLFRQIQSAR